MTTAHRPTYHPAIGRVHAGGYRYHSQRAQFSSRELPAHLTLKTRQDLVPQDQAQLKLALLESERKHMQTIKDERARQGILDDDEDGASSVKAELAAPEIPSESAGDGGGEGGTAVDLSKYDDEDDAPPETRGTEDSDEDSDDDSDEDAELARELDLIRREREEAKLKAAEAEARAAEEAAQSSIHSNPLLAPAASASSAESASATGVKRRWDSDVVFKNQAKGDLDSKPKKRFINDTIRSDFHRSFLNKYVH